MSPEKLLHCLSPGGSFCCVALARGEVPLFLELLEDDLYLRRVLKLLTLPLVLQNFSHCPVRAGRFFPGPATLLRPLLLMMLLRQGEAAGES